MSTSYPAFAQSSAPDELLRSLRPVIAPLLLFSCMTNLLIGTGPLFMLQVVDRVLPTGNLSTLVALLLMALVALLVMAVLEYLRGIMMTRAASWWERDMTLKLLPAATGGAHTASQISTSIARVGRFLSGTPLQAVVDAPWALLFFAFAFLVHPTIALVGIVIAIALILLAVAGHVLGRTTMQQAISTRMQANGLVNHLDQNRKLLSTMGMAPNLIGLQHGFLTQSHSLQNRSAEADQARRATARLLRAAMQVLVLGTGAWLVVKGELSGGAMIASSILLARALAPIEQLTGSLPAFAEFRLAYRDLQQTANPAPVNGTCAILPEFSDAVSCQNLTVTSSPGKPPILHQINASFTKGECVAMMGSSGAGKTTLIELLAGATTPNLGTVRIDGFDLQGWTPEQRAQMIGYLPQQPVLFPGTIAENIARFQPDADQNEVLRASVAGGVHGLISRLPEGYATRVSFDSSNLSGGERQRIALARALFLSPQILILDEPNAALDKEGERALISTLSHLKDTGVTIIMVAHRAGVLGMVDKIMVLDAGRVRDWGPKGEVFARMNARRMQIDLERNPAEASRLEEWVSSHFKRDCDAEARSTAAMVATEMFNISLTSNFAKDDNNAIRFTLKHQRGSCTISMLDTCELIASTRIDKLRRIADDEMFVAPALEGSDLALLMVMQLSETLDQKSADHGRVVQASIATPVRDSDDEPVSQEVH